MISCQKHTILQKNENNKKIFIDARMGCSRRKLDARRLAEYFKINDHEIVFDPEAADVIILITCGATNFGAEKAYKDIKYFKKFNAELIVAGCVPKIEPEELKKNWNGAIFSTRDLEDTPKKIDELFPGNGIKFEDIEDQNIPWFTIDKSRPTQAIKNQIMKNKTTARIYGGVINHIFTNIFGDSYMHFGYLIEKVPGDYYCTLRVSWGCSKKCTYCAIGQAIGKFKSKSLELCVKELEKCVEGGYKNIFLNSDDMGAYGTDINSTFPQLLSEMTKIPEDCNIKINALNPAWLVKYVDEISEILRGKKISSILSSIQSGNNRILKLMHRYSDRDRMIESFKKLKKAYPKLKISTQIIAGFPSETEEEFKETLQFIIESGIDMGMIYQMSLRPNTPAININPKISNDELEKRVRYAQSYLRKNGYKAIYYCGAIAFGGKR